MHIISACIFVLQNKKKTIGISYTYIKKHVYIYISIYSVQYLLFQIPGYKVRHCLMILAFVTLSLQITDLIRI